MIIEPSLKADMYATNEVQCGASTDLGIYWPLPLQQ